MLSFVMHGIHRESINAYMDSTFAIGKNCCRKLLTLLAVGLSERLIFWLQSLSECVESDRGIITGVN